ncbi:MAG TPA: DoxX family protein, partial [Chloroflexota bacterium]
CPAVRSSGYAACGVVAPLLLLIAALLAFRAAGALGVSPLADWHAAARFALVVMFAFTAAAHFGRQKDSLVRMVPNWVPSPPRVVAATGVLEFLGALGLLLSITAPLAAMCLVLLLLARFPANVKAAREQVMLDNKPATPIWFRTLVQLIFIATLLWATLS